MKRTAYRFCCPNCGHHATLNFLEPPPEAPLCSHVGTVCHQRITRMVAIVEDEAAT